jgi:prepilin-type N-terminal cleavage/methylation domain-containing protein
MVGGGMNERGMTLLEVLVAVGIISVGLVALSSAIPIAAYGIQEGKQLSTATFLATQRMEQVRNATWQAASDPGVVPQVLAVDKLGVSGSETAAPVGDGGAVTFPDETPVAAPYADYNRTVRITDCGAAGCAGITNADLRQVTVTVTYRPMTGVGVAPTASKSARVTMLVTKR